MMWCSKVLVVLPLLFLGCAEGYNILLVFGMPGTSLSLIGASFVRYLTDAGHQVTYITPLPLKNKPLKNFREIDVSKGLDKLFEDGDMFNISYLLDHKDTINNQEDLMHIGVDVAELTLSNDNVQEFLNDPTQRFDTVIADYFVSELIAGVAEYYECPMIWSYSVGVDWTALRLVHEHSNPAYTTDYISFNVPPLTFLQRVEELWSQIHSTWIKRNVIQKREEAIYKRIFKPLLSKKGRILPSFEDIIYNASMVFANSHHAIAKLPGLPQNFKLIGGFHVQVPTKPLPEDLQIIMDNAKNGVIYFSMGSIWKSQTMPQKLRDELLRLFGGLRQTVFWKFEGDIPNLPKNVHTLQWAPQQSILAHPNCLLFISHGGQLSSTEALHFGVPTIGVPIYFDQFVNINKAVAKGYAIKVKLSHNLPEDLKVAIDAIVNDPSYNTKAKEVSWIYHHRPVAPGDEMVHWVEHVVHTRGAAHLRSPALTTPWHQKMFLDLLAVIVMVLTVLVMVLKKIVGCFGKKKSGGKKKKN